ASLRPHAGRTGGCDARGRNRLSPCFHVRVAPGTSAPQGGRAPPCREPVPPFADADGGHPTARARLACDREHGVRCGTLRLRSFASSTRPAPATSCRRL